VGITIRLSTLVVTSFAAFAAQAQQMTAVTQLGWLRNGEYAPIMMADAKGFFKEEGIDHRIVDGGPGKNPVPIVAVGQPLFCNANFRTMVDPRDLGVSDADAKYPPVMSGDFLMSRFKATRKLWGAEDKAVVSNDDRLIEKAVD
jgi:hypothetical protein